MKELFTQTSSGQLVPITIEATLQQTTDALIQHLTKSHPLTLVSQFKTTPEDELPLWMSIMKDDIDVLVTQFQQQMYMSCISKTTCFPVNYAPHSLQPGRNEEP